MKPTTNEEKIIEREKILTKISELKRDPHEMFTLNMKGKMKGFNSLSSSSTCGNCPIRIMKAIQHIKAYGEKATELIDCFMLPSEDKKHITGKKCIKELYKIDPGMKICVCIFCYANRAQQWQDNARIKFSANHEILSNPETLNNLPKIPPVDFNGNQVHRYNAEGDCNSIVQAEIELKLSEENPGVICRSWTKNPGFYHKAYNNRNGNIPENFEGILSSECINQPDFKKFEYYQKKCPGLFTKLFTVITEDYAREHGITFNCCDSSKTEKKCKNCMICYTKNNIIYIWEILR